MDFWAWVAENIWSAAGLSTLVALFSSWLFDTASWWENLDGRLKVLIYAGLSVALLAASVGLALAFGHAYPDMEDLVGVLLFTILSLVGGPFSHEWRKARKAA